MQSIHQTYNHNGIDKCEDCPIKHRAVCAYCEKAELTLLETVKSYKTYQAGEPIIMAGDDMRFVGSAFSQ